jgi:hypothetical protein
MMVDLGLGERKTVSERRTAKAWMGERYAQSVRASLVRSGLYQTETRNMRSADGTAASADTSAIHSALVLQLRIRTVA